MQTAQVIPFRFESIEVRTLLVDDQPWFVAKDIICSLGYAKSSNPARLTEHVPEQWKGVNRIHTLGGSQKLLMLSEQGLYFFLGRSDKAKALPIQMWVAGEVLPSIRKHGRYIDQDNKLESLVGLTIGTDGFRMLGALVRGKVAALPGPSQRRATAKIWSQTHAAFGVRSAADIPADQLDSARNFIAAYALEGEWLPKEDQFEGVVNWPATRWLAESMPAVRDQMTALQSNGNITLSPNMLYGPSEFVSPTLRAIAELEQQGHNLEACRLEVLAMRHHLEEAQSRLERMRLLADSAKGSSIRFKIEPVREQLPHS